jgi:hypothetical protein
VVRQKRAAEAAPIYAAALPIIREMKDSGASLRAIADRLNAEGHSTVRGLPWNPMQVSRLVK